MSKPRINLREMALTATAAYRTKSLTVPEWGGVKVLLREPSSEAWLRFREIMEPEAVEGEEPPKPTQAQAYLRNKKADVVMFIDVLLDESGARVFSAEDESTVSEIYGPVHARLLSQALNLGISQEAAEAK